MFKAAWKSLLGRKLRLLMSTFAIVIGVAFVSGSLIFTDTLSRSFEAIFASSVGDVIVRPEGGTSDDGSPTTGPVGRYPYPRPWYRPFGGGTVIIPGGGSFGPATGSGGHR